MSANDYIKIQRDGKEYIILHLDAETNQGSEIARKKGLKVAIEWAEKYAGENMVEYGLHFGDL